MKIRNFLSVILATTLPMIGTTSQVSLSTSTNQATIGDQIQIRMIVKTTSNIENIRTTIPKKDFELLDRKILPLQKNGGEITYEEILKIAFFSIGDFSIGPFKIDLLKGDKVVESNKSNTISISIRPTLGPEDKDIKPLKGLIPLKGNPFYLLRYLFMLLGILLILVLFRFWYKKRKRETGIKEEPTLSPEDEFEKRLKTLIAKKYIEKGEFKPLFIHLTDIIKHFLQRKFLFKAKDCTTEETLQELKKVEKNRSIFNDLAFTFETADLVKFAKHIPEESKIYDIFKKQHLMIALYREKIRAEQAAADAS